MMIIEDFVENLIIIVVAQLEYEILAFQMKFKAINSQQIPKIIISDLFLIT
jgi:hypothetical protein